MTEYEKFMTAYKAQNIRMTHNWNYGTFINQYKIWNEHYNELIEKKADMNTPDNARIHGLRDIYKELLDELAPDESKDIKQLVKKLDNESQRDILNRITTDVEYGKIYLSKYVEGETKTTKGKYIGIVYVWGTYNAKKAKREEYEIKISKEEGTSMFNCSCPDHKFNSVKKNIMCKHVCFLICKVAKMMKRSIFLNKRMTQEDLNFLLDRLKGDSNTWVDKDLTKIKISLKSFQQFIKPIDDCCPLCYNDMTEDDKPTLISCPVCKNYIHKECADIWLEKHNTCTFCKSDVWKNYKENVEVEL